jgi:hypothetical protein
VDLKEIQVGQTVHLNDITLPKGVEAVQPPAEDGTP